MSKTPKPDPTRSESSQPTPKPRYVKPELSTESLTAVAALCNGTTTGGRKATTPACQTSKLKS